MPPPLESRTRSLLAEIADRQKEISLLQAAESTLNLTSNSRQELSELATQARSGKTDGYAHQDLQLEIEQLKEKITSLQNEVVNNTAARSRLEDLNAASELIKTNLQALGSKAVIQAFRLQDENRATILGLIDS